MSPADLENSSRLRLLEAAILCFAEKGFDATGIREIALKAKANSALVQYHFGGKTGLYAAALNHIFTSQPVKVPRVPDAVAEPDARAQAIRTLGELVEAMLDEFIACRNGGELDRASLLMVTRELQSPRTDVAALILEHVRPYIDISQGCLKVLRPDLDWTTALDYTDSIFGQVAHFMDHLPLMRIMRGQPDFPRDLRAVARHITDFSLRGIGIPEAFPGA